MKIGVCSDHRGVYIKEKILQYLEHSGYEVIDYGTDNTEGADFPEYAYKVGNAIARKEIDRGIAICGTGIGMSIVLNKIKGVYCAKIDSLNDAVLCRQHNDCNAISFSADLEENLVFEMIDKFLETDYLNDERRIRRNKMIKEIEKNG